MECLNNISNTLFDIKQKINNQEYKTMMESLMTVHKHIQRYNEQTENIIVQRRECILFDEYINLPKRKVHCGLCGCQGHNRRTCPERQS